ncbi:MAG: hypothetical protein ACRDVW_11745, partial [Acidimicrobiales bacterium]
MTEHDPLAHQVHPPAADAATPSVAAPPPTTEHGSAGTDLPPVPVEPSEGHAPYGAPAPTSPPFTPIGEHPAGTGGTPARARPHRTRRV